MECASEPGGIAAGTEPRSRRAAVYQDRPAPPPPDGRAFLCPDPASPAARAPRGPFHQQFVRTAGPALDAPGTTNAAEDERRGDDEGATGLWLPIRPPGTRRRLDLTQIACGMIGFRRGLAAGLMAAGLLAIASPSAAQLGPPPPPRAASAKPGDQKVLLNWKVPLPEHYADWDGPAVRHYEYRVRPEGGVFPSTWTRIPEYTGRVGGGLDERYAVEKLANGTPLSNGTSYFFEMRSENARGEGEATDEFSSTPVANTPATFEMTDETFTSGPSGIIVPRVPAVLLANLVGDIDDAEGIQIATGLDDRYTWQWQWIRVKDGVETEIPHATATGAPAGGYTLTPADVGSEIKARMRFRDDAYNQEEWVSPPTPTILPAALCRAPNLEGGRTLLGSDQIRLVQLDQEGQSQLRVGSAQGSFTLGGYGFSAVYHAIEGLEAGQLVLKLESQVNDTDQRQLALHVCEEVYPLYGDEIQINRSLPFTPRDNFRWPNSTDWSDLVTRTIHLSRDTAPPRLASVVFSEPPRNDFSPSLFIAFDEKLGDPDPVVADFTVEVDGSAVELNGGEFRTAPEGIRLTLAEPLPAAYSSLTVAYTQAAGHFVIQDPPGNRTPDFKVSVPYRRTPPPPPPTNAPPLAVDDAAQTAEDTPVTIAVLANDSDPDGDTLTVAGVSEPAHGTAVLTETGAVRYTPEPNFNGTDGFTYVVGDGSGLTAQAAVEVTVRPVDAPPEAVDDAAQTAEDTPVDVTVLPVNNPPEAVDDAAETAEDTPVNIAVLANDSDPEGDPLTVAEVSAPAHGTAVLTEAGTVQYAPEPDYHGPDRFTYVVSSGSGLTARAAVEVTVLPANDPPEVLGVIPDQTLEAGDGPASLDLSPYFEDRDGDSLGYTAVASDAVALSLAGATLTLTVARPGAATVTVTAQDPGGLTAAQAFLVTTSDRQARGVVEDTLAAMGRGHLASARATLGRRAAATGREESRITVAGMHVPLGTDDAAAAGRALAERWITGLAGGMPPPGAGWPGMGPGGPGAFDLAGPGLGGAGGAPVGAAGPGRRGAGTSSAFSGLSPFAGRGQTEFQLALGEEAGDGSEPGRRWTVWGQLDVQAFQGGRSPASRYDGALRTAYVGVDARLGERWLAGVAVTRSNADGDWSFGSSTGRLTTQLTSLQPYLRWSDGGTSIWATAGGGRGTAENERTRYGLQEESGLGLRMGLVEVRRRLATVGPGVELALRGDVSWARLATAEGGELIDALEADVHQLRVGVDVSRLLRTAGGTSVEPFGEVHARHDGGSGQTGAGLEVAGGLRVARGVFRVEGMGRLLGLHAAESYREHGAAVTLSVGEGARRPGLTLSLSPRWGAPATASDALWRDQLFHQQTPGGPVAGRYEGALDTRFDYGLQLPSGGLLTPFGLYGRSPYGQRLQAGLLLDRLGPLGLEVSGERHALPQQGRDEYRMTVLGSITFGGPDGAPARRSGAP